MPVPKWVVSSSTMRILQNRICLSTACHLGPRVPIYQPGVRSALDTGGRLGGVGALRGPGEMSSGRVPKPVFFDTFHFSHTFGGTTATGAGVELAWKFRAGSMVAVHNWWLGATDQKTAQLLRLNCVSESIRNDLGNEPCQRSNERTWRISWSNAL